MPSDPSSRRRFLAGLALGASGGAGGLWLGQRCAAATSSSAAPPTMALDHARYMRLAIAQAHKVPDLPFGAVIVDSRSEAVLADGHNRSKENPTFHGEMDVINR